MLKRTSVLSLALVTIMALTAVSGAGVVTAAGSTITITTRTAYSWNHAIVTGTAPGVTTGTDLVLQAYYNGELQSQLGNTKTTDTAGSFAFDLTGTAANNFYTKAQEWAFSVSSLGGAVGGSVTPQRISAALTASGPTPNPIEGGSFALTGTLTDNNGNSIPAAEGIKVWIYDAQDTKLGAGTIGADGKSWSYTLTAPTTAGTYQYKAQAQSTVYLQGSVTDPITVTVTVNPANAAPTANAGPDQTVKTQSVVTLTGSSSTDPDGDTLTYAWTLSDSNKPPKSRAQLSDTTAATPTFKADKAGTYKIQLVVTDAHGVSSAASDEVIIIAVHKMPR